MTTEIAVMNKTAVALAADSAVTITMKGPQGNSYKVLNSANKLFSLSKFAPVGLMVYGNASLLGIPWETIVKMYRAKLDKKSFPKLSDFCEDFFNFLDHFNVPRDAEVNYLNSLAYEIFSDLRAKQDQWVKEQIDLAVVLTGSDIERNLKSIILEANKTLKSLQKNEIFTDVQLSRIRKKYKNEVFEIIDKVFERLPIANPDKSKLVSIAINAATIGKLNQSGIVIAGFGDNDLYPSCCSYDVAAIFEGKTIKRNGNNDSIDSNNTAAIIPFAQSDDVHTFMEGIGPTLSNFLDNSFRPIITTLLPDRLSNEIASSLGLNQMQKDQVAKIVTDICQGSTDFAFQKFKEQKLNSYVLPIIKATGFLNMNELAEMAETLVNLVSFRKQVTMEAETVGGPIDVAVITKGDGLIWIKRKLYFDPELNHHFFSKYYMKGE